MKNNPNVLSMFFDQFFATSLFIITILSITEKRNTGGLPHAVISLLIGLSLTAIGSSFGFNCGFAVNPARDFGPRFFTLIAGWGGKTFSAGNYFFWIPLVVPMLGSVFGTIIYSLFISNHFSDAD